MTFDVSGSFSVTPSTAIFHLPEATCVATSLCFISSPRFFSMMFLGAFFGVLTGAGRLTFALPVNTPPALILPSFLAFAFFGDLGLGLSSPAWIVALISFAQAA